MKMSTGCDLVNLPRFQKAMQNKRFVARVFSAVEQNYCNKKKDHVASYAVRFAAKEAFSKALGTGFFTKGIGPHDMWIENEKNGKPVLMVSAKLRKKLDDKKVSGWDVSLSHHQDYAIATVVMWWS